MIGALLYLRVTSLRNQLVSRLKRLRNPKYLAGAIAGLAYVYFFFFRHVFGPSPGPRTGRRATQATELMQASFAETLPLVAAVGALLLLTIVLVAWLLPSDKPGLRFTEAETAFLFPAPISRRALINFKLLSSQVSILFTSLFFTLISNRWDFLGGNALTHAVGWWVVLSMLNLHFTGAALSISRLVEGGVSPLRRRLYVLGALLILLGATVAWVRHDLTTREAVSVTDLGSFTRYVVDLLDHGAFGLLLLPFKAVLAPFLAADAATFLRALVPALGIVALHYVWVLRMETSFEEASLALAEKRTVTLAAMREGKRPFAPVQTKGRAAPFRLPGPGRPELAFLWKNLLSTAPYLNLRTLAIAGAVILAGSKWFLAGDNVPDGARFMVMALALGVGAYILLLGPHIARQDLRSDLSNADILKTYPLRGWQVLLGQLLTPVAILTGLIWLCILAAALAFRPSGKMAVDFTVPVQIALAIGAAAVVPLLCALQLVVLNGATLLFPAWFQSTRFQAGSGGIEVMGQRLIFIFGQFFVVLVAMIPAGLGAVSGFGLVWLVFNKLLHYPDLAPPLGIALGAMGAFTMLIAEAWFSLKWLGERFEHLDVSSELRP